MCCRSSSSFLSTMFSLLVFLLGVLCSSSLGQDIQRCTKVVSEESPKDLEFHCSCMESLVELNEPIYKLTVNQTGCPKDILKLDWSTLQAFVGVKKVFFDHANVIFEDTMNKMTNYSIIELSFNNSILRNISTNALKGLKLIETIRIVNSEIDSIEGKSFSGLNHLKTIEFANSTINVVKSDAFFNLPLIEELAFISSSIEILETDAIHIMISPKSPKTECTSPIRGRTSASHLMNDLVGKSLNHLENVSLPTHGSKLIFFTSEVNLLSSKSISTDNFAFIIFGGNVINEIESKAINSVIQNDCDIAAILLVGNHFKKIKSEAFIDITGSEASFNTVISIVDNIFENVDPKGFLLDPKMKTSFIKENRFSCSDCHQFMWLLSNEESETQIRMEKELVETSECIEKKNLTTFLNGCPDDYSSTLVTEISTESVTEISTEAEPDFSSTHFTDQPNKPTDASLKSSKSEVSLSLSLIVLIAIVNCALFFEEVFEVVRKRFSKLFYKTELTEV